MRHFVRSMPETTEILWYTRRFVLCRSSSSARKKMVVLGVCGGGEGRYQKGSEVDRSKLSAPPHFRN